jgi:catechol 2,3-dioxygenase-like lactoylglutathione lyase family enzyme
MEKDGAFPNDFPINGVERRLLPCGEPTTLARLSFYRDVLGARVVHELPGTLCLSPLCREPDSPVGAFWFQIRQACRDRSAVSRPQERHQRYSAFGLPPCSAAYELLRSRGAEFLTPPAHWSDETRAFFHDPDGHLPSDLGGAGSLSEQRMNTFEGVDHGARKARPSVNLGMKWLEF